VTDKIVISAAIVGGRIMRDQHPGLPYTPEEFAAEAYRCMNEGAAVVHIHPREPDTGAQTANIAKSRAVFDAIRNRCPGLIINISTGEAPGFSMEERIGPVAALEPEMASLNTSSMNFAGVDWRTGKVLTEYIFENPFRNLIEMAKTMRQHKVKPELEVFDFSGIYNVLLVRKQGIFEEPLHFQLVFGVAGGIPYDVFNLARMRDLLPQGSSWSVIGVGPNQFPAVMTSAANGGHIRVGLEDNVRMPDKRLAKGSYEQVQWAVQLVRLLGREVATPNEAKEIFHIPKRG